MPKDGVLELRYRIHMNDMSTEAQIVGGTDFNRCRDPMPTMDMTALHTGSSKARR